MTSKVKLSTRAGRYVEQPTGYRAFLPAPLPPDPPVELGGNLQALLSVFVDERTLSANQIEFVNLIVDALTERGVMEPAALYASPFTDLAPRGPEGIFRPEQVERILEAIASVRASAAA